MSALGAFQANAFQNNAFQVASSAPPGPVTVITDVLYSLVQTNMHMFLGDTKEFQDNIIQPDGVTPQDVTGWTFSFVIHAPGDPGTVYLTLTSAGSRITIPTPTNGQIFWTIYSATDIPLLGAGQYGWYVQRTDTPNPITLSAGLFTINQQ